MRAPKKFLVTVALAMALLAALAMPAAATTQVVDLTSGTWSSVLGDLNLTPGASGTPPCPDKPSTAQLTASGSAGSGNWSMEGMWSHQFQLPAGSGNWYQMDTHVLRGSSGTYVNWIANQASYTVSGVLATQMRIYQLQLAGGPLNCEKSNLRCIITGVYAISGNFWGGSLTAWLPILYAGGTFTFSGSTTAPQVVSSCTAPWSSVSGTNANFTAVALTVI